MNLSYSVKNYLPDIGKNYSLEIKLQIRQQRQNDLDRHRYDTTAQDSWTSSLTIGIDSNEWSQNI